MMKRSLARIAIIVIGLMIPISAVAHVPEFPKGSEDIRQATVIEKPAKSWAVYGELRRGGEAHYYRMELEEDDRILLSLLVTTDPSERDFTPSFTLMGPGLTHKEGEEDEHEHTLPAYLEVPEGYGTITVEGQRPPKATYEAFSPSSFYSLGDLDLRAPTDGTYYVAVHEPSAGGRYSLVVGYVESFTLREWVLVPVSLISVYRWEGQGLLMIFSPMLLTVAIGLVLMAWHMKRRKKSLELQRWLTVLAGLTFVGSGSSMFFQMAFTATRAPLGAEAVVTLLLAILPILVGLGALRLGLDGTQEPDPRTRIKTFILGLLALFVWAGFVIGPILAFLASVMPRGIFSRAESFQRGRPGL